MNADLSIGFLDKEMIVTVRSTCLLDFNRIRTGA